MKINLDEIKNSPENKLEINFSDYIEDFNLKDKVKAALVASASNYGVNISGKIKADILLECDRCLKEYECNLDFDINEKFVTNNIIPENQKDYELGEDDFVEELNDSQEIDIKDLIYQSIILELPYKSLCTEDCPGFEDQSKTEYIDERLEVFKTFSENKLSKKK